MKSRMPLWVVFSAFTLLAVTTVQAVAYKVSITKIFGYSWGSQIRGTMNIAAAPEEGIRSVNFTIDGENLAEVNTPPFKAQFNTNDYSVGWHALAAVVTTTSGETLSLTPRRLEFVSAEVENQAVIKIIYPTLGGLLAVMVVGMGIQFWLMGRNKKEPSAPGAARPYGIAGGGVCPKCSRPTPLHLMGIKLLPGYKFDRCENCGKWSSIRRLSEAELRRAEQTELEMSQPDIPESKTEEEKLRDMLDQSRFTNS
jgi:hypothetical protein